MLRKILKQIAIELLLKWLEKLGQNEPQAQQPPRDIVSKKRTTRKKRSVELSHQLKIEE